MLKRVFVVYQEPVPATPSFELLSGEGAESFLNDPAPFCKDRGGATMIGHWIVPDKLENETSTGDLRPAFEAMIGLDAFGDEPLASDLAATIFAAGFALRDQLIAPEES